MYNNLRELTGQESGLVLYGNEGILCNWSGINGYPRIFVTGLVGLNEEIPEVEGKHTDNIGEFLEDIDINAYSSDDIEIPTSGIVYEISDEITVIAPDGWN